MSTLTVVEQLAVNLPPLPPPPGTPGGRLAVDQIAERALEEAGIYHQHRVVGDPASLANCYSVWHVCGIVLSTRAVASPVLWVV